MTAVWSGRGRRDEGVGRIGGGPFLREKNMAVTLSTPISAAGRRVLAFFKSVFVLVADAIRRVFHSMLHLFPSFTLNSSSPTNGQRKQTDHLCSATNSSAPQKPGANFEDLVDATVSPVDNPADCEGNSFAMPVALSSSAAQPAPAARSLPKKVPVPNIVPALPRLPLPPMRENVVPKPAAATPPVATTPTPAPASDADPTISHITSRLSRLRMDGGVDTEAPSPSLQPQRAGEDASAKESIAGTSIPPAVATFDPLVTNLLSDISNSTPREVVRAPAVPLHHGISQTSKLKDTTTITVGKDNVQIQAQVETPEQAAERAMHSAFMREALDMVSSKSCLTSLFLSSIPAPRAPRGPAWSSRVFRPALALRPMFNT